MMKKIDKKKLVVIGIITAVVVLSGLYVAVLRGTGLSEGTVPITQGYRAEILKDAQYIGPADPNQEIWVTISLKWKNDEELN
ncbi:MAG: hypothetical protein GXO25_07945, partial [Euryarchaeota archaeon]|nr:hypothetical protein [Euryarchaeota archaeon]